MSATQPFAIRFAAARAVTARSSSAPTHPGPLLERWGLGDSLDGLERFIDIVLAAATGAVGLIKPQPAFYERHGWQGIRALTRLITAACPERVMPSASRSLLAAGPGPAALRDAAAALNDEFRTLL
jgi:hypothetical protein